MIARAMVTALLLLTPLPGFSQTIWVHQQLDGETLNVEVGENLEGHAVYGVQVFARFVPGRLALLEPAEYNAERYGIIIRRVVNADEGYIVLAAGINPQNQQPATGEAWTFRLKFRVVDGVQGPARITLYRRHAPPIRWSRAPDGNPLYPTALLDNPADLVLDGKVDIADFNVFAGCYGRTQVYQTECWPCDFTGDRVVDILDFATFAGSYGNVGDERD